MDRHPRIAYFSPLPPARTGIADYSQELLPHLGRLAEIALFVDDPSTVGEPLASRFRLFSIDTYAWRRWDFDVALYQMGNSHFHAALYDVFRHHPGILVLHDYDLHHFVAGQTLCANRHGDYLREMAYALGGEGIERARSVRQGRCLPPFFEVPLNTRLIDLSLGIIVHSDFTRRRLLGNPSARAAQGVPQAWSSFHHPIAVIPAPIAAYPAASKRSELGWDENVVVFGSFGQITESKQIERTLSAFARVHEALPLTRYLVVGETIPTNVDLPASIRALGLDGAVHCTGHVPALVDFTGWIATADVVVNLRFPTVGETSATALRGLAAGRPLIVFDHGWYSELPDDACVKVPPVDDAALQAAMHRLANDPARRQEMGRRAAEYAAAVHAPARAAEAYVAFIEQILAHSRPPPGAVVA